MNKIKLNNIIENNEKISFSLLLLWCLLPAIMTLIVFYFYLTKQLPTVEAIINDGLFGKNFHYHITTNTYISLFNILGLLTFIHVIFTMIIDYKSIFSKENFKKKPWYYLVFAFMIWATLACLFSEDPFTSFDGYLSLNAGFRTDLIYILIFFLATTVTDERKRTILIKLFGFVVIYISILMIIRENGNPFLEYCFPQWRAVVFCQFNHFGYVLCMAIMSFVGLYLYENSKPLNKIYYLLATAFLTYALLVNDTFGSYLATFVCFPLIYVIYGIKNRKLSIKAFLPFILFIILSVLSYTNNLFGANSLYTNLNVFSNDLGNIIANNEEASHAGTGRMTLWRDTIQRIKDKPLLGYGELGLRGKYAITNDDSPHNEFLGIAAYFGIPALLIYLSFLFSVAINKFKHLKDQPIGVMITSCIVIVYLASSFFGNALFTSYPFYMMFLGLTINDNLFNLKYDKFKENFSKKEGPKKLIIICVSIILIGTLIGILGMKKLKDQTEYNNELADLEMMKLANSMALFAYNEKIIEPDIAYPFDATNLKLYSYDEKVSPYGRGTKRNGLALNDFLLENDYDFEYDETMDYTDKIIKVIITIIDDKPNISVNWVSAE